ncbi:MAG: hypothetical protein AAF665_04800 [Pseudomonadota bacterium]
MATTANAANCPATTSEQVEIYPTAEVLPENLLRMYVYFPRSMGIDEGLRNVHLLDDNGVVIDGVFLTNRVDLWSVDQRRLTLVLDPGRVKTGLKAHDQLGRALAVDQSYTLLVSGSAMDAEGCAIGDDARHRFSVEAPDNVAPAPSQWVISTPEASTLQPLTIDLGSPHDHVSLAYRIRVLDSDGAILPGKIMLGSGESTWNFIPRRPWSSTGYSVMIDGTLEDLAGNRPGRLFDSPSAQTQLDWINHLHFAPRAP